MVQEITTEYGVITTPFIKPILGGYTLGWLDHICEGLTVNVTHIQQSSHGDLTGEITVWFDFMTQEKPTLSGVRLNLLSEGRRTSVAKRLVELRPKFPWNIILEQVCHEVIEAYRLGDPGELIEVVDLEDKDIGIPQYLLDPIILKGVPSVIYGDKGCHKTTMALAAAGTLYSSWSDNPFGFGTNGASHICGLLDYESSKDLTMYTLQRLRRGSGIPYFDLAYRHCQLPLADDLEAIAKFLNDKKVDIVIIDSLGAACGGDLFKPEPALRFFEGLRQLKTTSLIIAQNSKGEEGKKTIFGSTFFTYYARNIFEIKKFGEFDEKIESYVALVNTENNYTAKREPMGFHLSFTNSAIKIGTTPVSLAQLIDKANIQQKVLKCLEDAGGAVSVNDIASLTNSKVEIVKVVLTRLKAHNRVVNPNRGMWSLIYDENSEF